MGDLIFNGGKYGLWIGNQQFTVRNVTVNNAQTAFFGAWNWGWTFQGIKINNCGVGFDLQTGGLTRDTQTVGSEVRDADNRATGYFTNQRCCRVLLMSPSRTPRSVFAPP